MVKSSVAIFLLFFKEVMGKFNFDGHKSYNSSIRPTTLLNYNSLKSTMR